MKKLLVLALLLFFGNDLSATHALGGEITWQCASTGPNAGKFKFRLVFYRECCVVSFTASSISLSSNSPAGSITCQRVGTPTNVAPIC